MCFNFRGLSSRTAFWVSLKDYTYLIIINTEVESNSTSVFFLSKCTLLSEKISVLCSIILLLQLTYYDLRYVGAVISFWQPYSVYTIEETEIREAWMTARYTAGMYSWPTFTLYWRYYFYADGTILLAKKKSMSIFFGTFQVMMFTWQW